MPSSTYTALNGREIKEIAKNRVIAAIDKLPYLREGNSFHNAKVEFAFVMTAFPADVPVPTAELEFEISTEATKIDEAVKQIEMAESLADEIEGLESLRNKVDELLNKALEARGTIVYEEDKQMQIDGEFPDKARMEADLNIPVINTISGKRVEATISTAEFKKVIK